MNKKIPAISIHFRTYPPTLTEQVKVSIADMTIGSMAYSVTMKCWYDIDFPEVSAEDSLDCAFAMWKYREDIHQKEFA